MHIDSLGLGLQVCEKFRALLERKKQVKKVSTKKKFTVTDDRVRGEKKIFCEMFGNLCRFLSIWGFGYSFF